NHAALRPGRCASPAGSGETVRRRKGRRSARATCVSGRRRIVPALRRRREILQLPQGRVDGNGSALDRSHTHALTAARAGIENARARKTQSGGEGGGADEGRGVRGPTSRS